MDVSKTSILGAMSLALTVGVYSAQLADTLIDHPNESNEDSFLVRNRDTIIKVSFVVGFIFGITCTYAFYRFTMGSVEKLEADYIKKYGVESFEEVSERIRKLDLCGTSWSDAELFAFREKRISVPKIIPR